MDSNQNLSSNSSFGMLNTGQANPTPQNNNVGINSSNMQSVQTPVPVNTGVVNPANAQPTNPVNVQAQSTTNVSLGTTSAPSNVAQSNVVTLGTVSNVTYADTIGDINYDTPPQENVDTSNNTSETFINPSYNENTLSDLNVEGTYNNMNVSQDYMNDPKVMENIHPDPEKKKTITIGKELKTFILIALVLLVFIFVLPILANIFNKIRFH